MSKQWQIRRGTTAENNEFTGAQGELTMDTDTGALRVHDGTTLGGAMILGRNFTTVNTVIASGTASIAGVYNLGFTDGRVKIGVFQCSLLTTQAGYSSLGISSDVMTPMTNVCGTNDQFKNEGTITIPFINSITIGFPQTGAGVASGTSVKFIGWM